MPSLAVFISTMAFVQGTFAHVGLLSIYGSNNIVGHAFGVNTEGRFPRILGEAGDGGADSGIFETGTDNPNPPCGKTPELGNIDVASWLNQAEALGVPAAYANGSVMVGAFQINADGGGPMSCEYNQDATATSWNPMKMTLNQPGREGVRNLLLTNVTVVMDFPPNAVCDGGFTRSVCIVRCRTGVNKRFGGCFAVKLAGTESSFQRAVINPAAVNRALSTSEINAQAQSVVDSMKNQGLFVAASADSERLNTDAKIRLAESVDGEF